MGVRGADRGSPQVFNIHPTLYVARIAGTAQSERMWRAIELVPPTMSLTHVSRYCEPTLISRRCEEGSTVLNPITTSWGIL